jgi:DNA-binding NtrC family response regulator
MPIALPPLRQRREDIPLLVEKTLDDIVKETGKKISKVNEETMDVLLAYHWPGNIRELINALRFASICCPGNEIHIQHLPAEVQEAVGYISEGAPTAETVTDPAADNPSRKEKLSTETVQRALSEANGNKVLAAKLLKVSRATLYRFLERNPLS